MDSIPKSNRFYANRVIRLYLLAIEEVIGKKGLNATLNLANLSHLVDNYPPENMEKQFDFADFSTINMALEEIYGDKGGRLLSTRAGKVYFESALRAFGSSDDSSSNELLNLPILERMRAGLARIVQLTNQMSDQNTSFEERENDFVYTVQNCAACWGRSGESKPICAMPVGFLQGFLSWLLEGKEYSLREEKCVAVGDEHCVFIIDKPAAS
ncbi:MAG: 4-vinyl reductase [Anaerolineales bacterium]|nr:4-vinyl reductase [Anaerolineales bacterium]